MLVEGAEGVDLRGGWQTTGDMDIGKYHMFGRSADDMVGGMMKHPPGEPRCAWVYDVRVASCDEAFATAEPHGATPLYPPMDVPSGDRSALLADPQAAAFGIVEPQPA